jgi:hypothetical protein
MSIRPIKALSNKMFRKKSPIKAEEPLKLWISSDSQNPIPIPCSLKQGESISSDGTWVKLVSSSQQFFFRTQTTFNFCGQTFFVGTRPPTQSKKLIIRTVIIFLPIATIASAFPFSFSRNVQDVLFFNPQSKPFDQIVIERASDNVIFESHRKEPKEKKEIVLPVLNGNLKKGAAPSENHSTIDPMRCSPIPKVTSQGSTLGSVDHPKQQEENWFVCR